MDDWDVKLGPKQSPILTFFVQRCVLNLVANYRTAISRDHFIDFIGKSQIIRAR